MTKELTEQLEQQTKDFKAQTKQVEGLEKQVKDLVRKPETGSELKYQAKISSLGAELKSVKTQLVAAVKEEGIYQAIADDLDSMVVPLEPLPTVYEPDDSAITEHLVMHLSDEHADQIVNPEDCGGLETYNFDVALCRAEKYVKTIIDWVNHLSNHTFPMLHILSYGDHTSGEIHGAVGHSQYKNMFRNSLAIGQMQALMIRDLAPYFEEVKIYCVSGNHGRRSQKKDFHGPWDNWDYLISEVAKLHCAALDNVEFLIPKSFSMNIDINGHGFGMEHGDGVKGWMGIPWYGLERKTRRLVSLHNAVGKQISYFVFGHFHALSTNADLKGEMIINGAWLATDAYSYNSFSGYREPMQLIHGVHEKYGITWRLPIKLKDEKQELKGPERYSVILADEE